MQGNNGLPSYSHIRQWEQNGQQIIGVEYQRRQQYIRSMQNRKNTFQFQPNNPVTHTSSRNTQLSPSIIYSTLVSPRSSSPIKNRFFPFQIADNSISTRHLPVRTTLLLGESQNPHQRSESVYRNHQTKHLLNRIRYLEAIIKEKDRRYKQEQQQKYRHMQSSESTTASIYHTHTTSKQSASSDKVLELQQKIKSLEKANHQQRIGYQRKIKQMEEYMETHFVEVESEVMDQEWMGTGVDDLESSLNGSRIAKGVYFKHQ